MYRFKTIISLLVALAYGLSGSVFADDTDVKAALIELLNNGPASQLGIEGRRMDAGEINEKLLLHYQEQGSNPLWVTDGGHNERAESLLDVLKNAHLEGLNSEDYHVSNLEKLWDSQQAMDLAKLEVLLTYSMAAYAADAREGRADPRKLDPTLFATARDVAIDPVALALEAVSSPDLSEFLASQTPDNIHYRGLKQALERYRGLAEQGGWPIIPAGETLKVGMDSPRILVVRQRLSITGDHDGENAESSLYDESLEAGVKRFQKRHHLETDGAIGKNTLAAMNIPVEKLIKRIVVNMERWRWLAHDLGRKRLFVNVAGFTLAGTEDDNVKIKMPVIVGKLYHKTPVFSESIKYIEINPYWNVPSSIAVKEMLPKLINDPYYLRGKNIRVYDGWGSDAQEVDSIAIDWQSVGRGIRRYKLRQEPGRKNALGKIKFMFPNKYNVYLHDTPGHSLFKRSRRAFSHGCIRVSEPIQLAAYLLGGQANGWPIERVKKLVASGKRTVVKLDEAYPVHILYRTAVVSDEGLVYFADDVYGRDKLLEKALF